MRLRRRWWDLAIVVVLVIAGVAIGVTRSGSPACSSAAVATPAVPLVFEAPDADIVRADPRLQRLITAIQGSGFGRVIGAVGYDQTRWLRSASLPDGFATWTADNAVIGFRDTAGRVSWGLRQTSDPQAWAVLGSGFVNLDLRPSKPVQIARYRSDTGAMDWCASVGKPTRYGDPLTVAAGADGSTWVVTAGPSLNRVGSSGAVSDPVPLSGVDRAAYVRQVGSVLIIGGRAGYLLSAPDPAIPTPSGATVSAFDARTLQVLWQWGHGHVAHVVGEAGGLVIVETIEDGRIHLVALDLAGRERWSASTPSGTTTDMVMTSPDRIVMRTSRSISGYSVRTGARLWVHSLGTVFPAGFDLARQADLGGRLLLATKSALIDLDPTTGQVVRYALPTDGSAQTYWPYEVVSSQHAVIVETNAGAVLVSVSS